MFDNYDNYEKKYKIKHTCNGTIRELTTQELYEFYIFHTHNINEDFTAILKRLDSGDTVLGDDIEFDFTMGNDIYKGQIKITKFIPHGLKINELPPPVPKYCSHKNKYINTAGGKKFYVCPNCKADLGDVK